MRLAEIATYGDTVHRFVERGGYDGSFLPGYASVAHAATLRGRACSPASTTSSRNVELGAMDEWVQVLRGRLRDDAS